ncbi:MAG: hypothetical protein M3O92_01025 [Actinomycetota bacterium]|nr:hypothetical protein [Actinomycetota bacterium]
MNPRAIVIRAVAVAFLTYIGVLSALAARDVLAWRGQTAHADVAVASFSPDLGVWRPHTWLPAGASQWLVGAGDDVEFGQALQHFQVFRGHQQWGLFVLNGTNGEPNKFARRTLELAQLEFTFEQIANSSRSADLRSRARQLHGILLFQHLIMQGGDAKTTLERAIADFTEAVRLDPGNATAKYDLEGLLYLYKPLSNGEPPPLKRRTSSTGPDSGGGGSPGSSAGAGGF